MRQRAESPLLTSRAKRKRRFYLRDEAFAGLMLAPGLLLVGGVLGFPLIYSFWASVSDVSLSDLSMQFIGLANYREVVQEPFFVESLINTLYFAVATILGTIVLGLLIAIVLNERFHGRTLLRSLIIVPWAISQIVVGIIWAWIYNGTFGILNAALVGVGLIHSYQGWLSNPRLAMTLVVIAFVWSSTPFAVIMYLAAMQSIPGDLYKAAHVDGAGPVQCFWYITLPALRYTSLVVLIVSSLDGLLAFSLIFVMTGGGPGTATSVLSWLGYQTTFHNLHLGQGTAIFYILVALMVAIAAAYIRVLQRPTEAEIR